MQNAMNDNDMMLKIFQFHIEHLHYIARSHQLVVFGLLIKFDCLMVNWHET